MLIEKFKSIGFRLWYFIRYLPIRVWRLAIFPIQNSIFNSRLDIWLAEWLLLLTDILGVPELLEIVHEMVNWKLRSLSKSEVELAQQYFGNSIKWYRVRINAADILFSKRYKIAFVSFYTINFHQSISLPMLIHELVHIWQFEKFGSLYIIRSLLAQVSEKGYNYGGIYQLIEDKEMGKKLVDYNFEQMGDVVKDAFLNDQGRFNLPAEQDPFPYFIKQLTH